MLEPTGTASRCGVRVPPSSAHSTLPGYSKPSHPRPIPWRIHDPLELSRHTWRHAKGPGRVKPLRSSVVLGRLITMLADPAQDEHGDKRSQINGAQDGPG